MKMGSHQTFGVWESINWINLQASERYFLKNIIANAANKSRAREVDFIHIGSKGMMEMPPNKTPVFCTKAVDLDD